MVVLPAKTRRRFLVYLVVQASTRDIHLFAPKRTPVGFRLLGPSASQVRGQVFSWQSPSGPGLEL